MAASRERPAPPPTGGVRLHLGCGARVVPGWRNLDSSRSARLARLPGALPLARWLRLAPPPPPGGWPRGIIHRDLRRPFPEADASVSAAYCSHVYEHLEEAEGRRFLREVCRVLCPGGLLRLVVPDARPVLEGYVRQPAAVTGQEPPLDRLCRHLQLFAGVEEARAGRLGRRYLARHRKHLHKWLYDEDSLTRRLLEAGFREVIICQLGESLLPEIDVFEADFPYPVSIFLDVVR